jgi:hypothetical protein
MASHRATGWTSGSGRSGRSGKPGRTGATKASAKSGNSSVSGSTDRSAAGPAVRVRMYRQGLGDCFLITFHLGGDEKHMLIDCGSLGATTTGVKLADVLANILETTGGRLDLLVATHEHKDHLSAFDTEKAEFERMKVANVWLAWTENPNDGLAKTLAKQKQDLAAALVNTAQALTRPGASEGARAIGSAVRDVLDFSGDPDALGAFSDSINDAMDFVRTKFVAKPRYCKPGDGPFQESWLDGFRFYVLGPPRGASELKATGEHGSTETYGVAAGLSSGAAFFASEQTSATDYLRASDPEARAAFIAAQPFDPRFRIERESDAARLAFGETYFGRTAGWRQIDEEWLKVGSELALQLDNITNNTSLALAIERVADGKVLLFPGDAQEGNWESWHDESIRWTVKSGTSSRTIRAADLLARTVFYKVGHHASHNATAKAKGLELMDDEHELVAFIPVDRAVALGRNPRGSWRMPAVALYRRLLEKCQGRVVRSDSGWAEPAEKAANKTVEHEFVGLAKPSEWAGWKRSQQDATNVTVGDLYVDYVLA